MLEKGLLEVLPVIALGNYVLAKWVPCDTLNVLFALIEHTQLLSW